MSERTPEKDAPSCDACGKPATTSDGVCGAELCNDTGRLAAAWDRVHFRRLGAGTDIPERGAHVILTDAEIDSLTECECGHWANEHSSDGCLATDFTEDWRPIRDDDKCTCPHSPAAINRHAIEQIVMARLAQQAEERDQAWRDAIRAECNVGYWCQTADSSGPHAAVPTEHLCRLAEEGPR